MEDRKLQTALDKINKKKKYYKDVLEACDKYQKELYSVKSVPWWDFWSISKALRNKPQILKDYKSDN